jgi:hypothetical protein
LAPDYKIFGFPETGWREERVEFENAGFLGAGDQPELFFFRFNSERIGVAISGSRN